MEQFNTLVASTLQSGVEPLQVRYVPVYDMYGEKIIGLVQTAQINSLQHGVISQDVLCGVADAALAEDLFCRLVAKAYRLVKLLRQQATSPVWVSVFAPKVLLFSQTVGRKIYGITQGERPSKGLFVTFGSDVLQHIGTARLLFSELENVGVRTAITGFGSADFPITSLMDVAPDMLFMTDVSAKLAKKGNAEAIGSLVNYAHNLGADVVAHNLCTDEQIRSLRSTDCLGATVSAMYNGIYGFRSGAMSVAQVAELTKDEV